MLRGPQEIWQCPNCVAEHPVHAFKLVGEAVGGHGVPADKRRCPSCGKASSVRRYHRLGAQFAANGLSALGPPAPQL